MALIYALSCKINGKAYIGCTKGKPGKRLREHRCLLNQKGHSCIEMMQDWHTFGSENFEMAILETFDASHVDIRRQREKYWMAEFNSKGLLYNTDMRSFELAPEQYRKGIEAATKANTGRIHTPEERLKRRLAQLGKPKGHGAKISATKQARKSLAVMR